MSFIQLMNMNMIIDIVSIVFFIAFVIKFRKIQNQLKQLNDDLNLVVRNPQAAKRSFKKRQ